MRGSPIANPLVSVLEGNVWYDRSSWWLDVGLLTGVAVGDADPLTMRNWLYCGPIPGITSPIEACS
jgi:hypothetical protein